MRRRRVVGIAMGSLVEDAEPMISGSSSRLSCLISAWSCCSCPSMLSISSDDARTCISESASSEDIEDRLRDNADTDFFMQHSLNGTVSMPNSQKPCTLVSAILYVSRRVCDDKWA